MRRPLRRRVVLRPDETVASLASRLAARNGTTLRFFCLDQQLSLHAVHDGRAEVGRTVAELSGHDDPDAFVASMLTRLGDIGSRDWSQRAQSLRTKNLNRSCRRVCPRCLAEDLAEGGLRPVELAAARSVWRIRHIRTCMVHGVALVEGEEEVDKYSTYDNAAVYCGLLRRLPEACEEAVGREPSAFEGYLLRRLDTGVGGVGWLDAKPMWAASFLVERVGTAKLFGHAPNLNRLTDKDWWDVGAEGIALLEGGPKGVRTVLDLLHDGFRFTRTGRNAPRRIYGQLWRWFEDVATGPEFDDVRDVMRDHALSRLPLAAGTDVLGHVLERRRVHSLRSVHVETGRHQRRLRKVFAGQGLLPDGHEAVNPNRLTFDAEQVALLLAGILAPMSTREVLDYLGVARVQPLIVGGAITPIATSGRKVGQHEFARTEVEGLMADLRRDAMPLEAIGPDHFDLIEACRAVSRDVAALISMIRERRLSKVWHLADGQGLRSVVISKTEVKALTSAGRCEHLALHEIVKRLRIHYCAVRWLLEHDKLETIILPEPRAGKPTRYVPEASIADFERRYITLFEAARIRETGMRHLKAKLISEGIHPVFDVDEAKTSIYERSNI